MNYENQHIDDLLGKYLAGEASEPEAVAARTWIAANDENRRYFNQLQKIFESSVIIRDKKEYDTDAAWTKLRSRLHGKQDTVVEMRPRSQNWWWQVAAAIVVLCMVGLFLFDGEDATVQELQVEANNKSVSDTLPNGTGVFLNKDTRLLYSYNENKKLHQIKLEGEAYFDIEHGPEEEVVVRAGEVFIRDIGTSFNVSAYPESDVVEVLVEDGEVEFYTAKNPGIRLKESGRAVYNKKTGEFTIQAPEPNITAYKTRFFVFSGTSLGEAVKSLNEVYDAELVIDERLVNCPITVSFRQESIEEIALVISETLGLELTHADGKIFLKGEACD